MNFYIAVVAQPDEDDLVADVVYNGTQVADVRREAGTWLLTIFTEGDDPLRVPFEPFLRALQEVSSRLIETE